MRLPGVVIFSLASLWLAGCSSTAGVDALQMPSNETTSSVVRPSVPVAAAPETPVLPPMSDEAVPVADNAPPFSLAEEEETIDTDTPLPQEAIEPPVEPVALVSQPKRLTRAAPPMLAGPVTRYGFRDAKPINFGPGPRPGTCRARRRRLALAGQCRLGKLRARVPISPTSRPPTAATISIRCSGTTGAMPSGRAEARRLSLLLLVPHRRRAGRLVHPQRAEG